MLVKQLMFLSNFAMIQAQCFRLSNDPASCMLIYMTQNNVDYYKMAMLVEIKTRNLEFCMFIFRP